MSFCGKKIKLEMKSETQFLRKKHYVLHGFETPVRYKIILRMGSIIQSRYIYLALSKVYF
jgi:hypothetical protein